MSEIKTLNIDTIGLRHKVREVTKACCGTVRKHPNYAVELKKLGYKGKFMIKDRGVVVAVVEV